MLLVIKQSVASNPVLKSIICAAFFLALPFALLFVYLSLPGYYTIGHDYVKYAIKDQLTLLFSISKGSFPLFILGYHGGQSSAAQLPTSEIFHPLIWLAYIIPGYWDGYALFINTCLRLLSLGVAQLVLYRLFCRLNSPIYWAFICSFIAVYNLRMLDCFRFGGSLESYTGLLFTCASISYIWLEPCKRKHLLWLVVSGYWLLNSGHPQMMYYGFIGIGIFAVFLPAICIAMLGTLRPSLKIILRYYMKCCACLLLVSLLCAPMLVPYYVEYILNNSERVNQDYNWSLAWSDSVMGQFSSFFFPFKGSIYGNFGGSALMLIAFFIPLFNFSSSGIMFPIRL